MDEFELFVGIDWGSEAHQVCVLDSSRKVLLECAIKHSGEALYDLTERLIALAGGIAAARRGHQAPRGPVARPCSRRASAFSRSIRSNSIASATGTRWLERRTTAETRSCLPIRCGRTCRLFDVFVWETPNWCSFAS